MYLLGKTCDRFPRPQMTRALPKTNPLPMAFQFYGFLIVLLLTCLQPPRVLAIPARHHHPRPNHRLIDLTTSALTVSSTENVTNESAGFDYLPASATSPFPKPLTVNFTATVTQYPPTTTLFIRTNSLGVSLASNYCQALIMLTWTYVAYPHSSRKRRSSLPSAIPNVVHSSTRDACCNPLASLDFVRRELSSVQRLYDSR